MAPPDPSLHRVHQKIIEVLGLPALNGVLVEDPELLWALAPDLKGSRVAGAIDGRPIDFKVSTTALGLRGAPLGPRQPGETRVLALGDSCTFGVGADDGETWPARLESLLSQGPDARPGLRVINAGVPGYSAFQGRRYLERRGLTLAPDIVIAAFGFNDYSRWGSRGDREAAAALRVARWQAPLLESRLVLGIERLLERTPPAAGDRRRLTAEEFGEELLGLAGLCAAHHIPMLLVIWPYAEQVRARDPALVRYQPAIAAVARETGAGPVNLVDAFLAAPGVLFLDHVHATREGSEVAAGAIAAAARPLLPPAGRVP